MKILGISFKNQVANIYANKFANNSLFSKSNKKSSYEPCFKQSNISQSRYIINFKQKNKPKTDRGQIIKDGKVYNCNYTSYFRDDINWDDLGNYLRENFKSLDDVDIHCFACSTGKEAYSLAILLKQYYNSDRFTIHASDIDKEKIEEAKDSKESGVTLESRDYYEIITHLDLYDDEDEIFRSDKPRVLRQEIPDCVEFENANMLDDSAINKISSENRSIIFCRNASPYISPTEYWGFAKRLYDRLAHGSMIVIGVFDCIGKQYEHQYDPKSYTLAKALEQNLFKPINRGKVSKLNYPYHGKAIIYVKV